MSSSTNSSINSIVADYAPWRRGIAWWVVLLQGLILLALGGLALWRTEWASTIIVSGLGIYFIVAAVWTIVQAMRGREQSLSVLNLLAAGGGLVAGIGVLIPFILRGDERINLATLEATSLVTFAVALMAVGLLWAFSAFVERPEGGLVYASLIRGVLFLALGIYILYGTATGTDDVVRWVAIASLVVGGALTIYSIILNRQQAAKASKAAASS